MRTGFVYFSFIFVTTGAWLYCSEAEWNLKVDAELDGVAVEFNIRKPSPARLAILVVGSF